MNPTKKRDLGMGTFLAGGSGSGEEAVIDPFTTLDDELLVEILSRVGSMNEVARCSSLLGKRWRDLWKFIDEGSLDFNKSETETAEHHSTPEERRRFANRVDQALICLESATRLDALKIGFDLFEMEEEAWRWLQFGLRKRVKELELWCCFDYSSEDRRVSLPLLTPQFLSNYDLSRLQLLELSSLSEIAHGALDYIFSNCPSLQTFLLYNSTFQGSNAVIRICCPNGSNSLTTLSFYFPDNIAFNVAEIELISAPGLEIFRVNFDSKPLVVKFRDDHGFPKLREAVFTGTWICDTDHYLPWSRYEFGKFAPGLQSLEFELSFIPEFVPPPEWLRFQNLARLDLSICFVQTRRSLLDFAVLLRAAPVLRQWSISFQSMFGPWKWERRDLLSGGVEPGLESWKHHSLQVLQLRGVHSYGLEDRIDPRKLQLELAAYIIINSPSLSEVLIDTANQRDPDDREPHEVDLDICRARVEMEAQLLHSHTATSQIHFTYQ